MKKRVFLLSIIGFCLVLFAGCSIQNFVLGLKKKSPGLANVSFMVPKNWKYVKLNDYISKYYHNDETMSLLYKNMSEKADLKFLGYMCKESADANICIFRMNRKKYEDVIEQKLKDSYDFAKGIIGKSGGGYGLKTDSNGIVRWETPGEITYFFIDKKYVYQLDLVILTENIGKTPFGGWYDAGVISRRINESIKFKTHGFIDGFVDGLFIVIKAPAHIINKDIRVFAAANNGFSYILAFVLGIAAFLVLIFKLLLS